MKNRKTIRKNRKKRNRKTIRNYKGGVGDMCSICHEDFIEGDNISTHTGCNNKFHTDCIKKWCVDKDECPCPICRDVIELPLSDHEKLLKAYNKLAREHNELVDEHNELARDSHTAYNKLVDRYDILAIIRTDLADKYNKLAGEHNELRVKFIKLQTEYKRLYNHFVV